MTKIEKALTEVAEEANKSLAAHIAAGGTHEVWAQSHPFESGILWATFSVSVKLIEYGTYARSNR